MTHIPLRYVLLLSAVALSLASDPVAVRTSVFELRQTDHVVYTDDIQTKCHQETVPLTKSLFVPPPGASLGNSLKGTAYGEAILKAEFDAARDAIFEELQKDVNSRCAKFGVWNAKDANNNLLIRKNGGDGAFWTAAQQIIVEQATASDHTTDVKTETILKLQSDNEAELKELRRAWQTNLIQLHLTHLHQNYAAFYRWVFAPEADGDSYLRSRVIDNLTDSIVAGRFGLLRDVLKESFRVNVLGCNANGDIALNICLDYAKINPRATVFEAVDAGRFSTDRSAFIKVLIEKRWVRDPSGWTPADIECRKKEKAWICPSVKDTPRPKCTPQMPHLCSVRVSYTGHNFVDVTHWHDGAIVASTDKNYTVFHASKSAVIQTMPESGIIFMRIPSDHFAVVGDQRIDGSPAVAQFQATNMQPKVFKSDVLALMPTEEWATTCLQTEMTSNGGITVVRCDGLLREAVGAFGVFSYHALLVLLALILVCLLVLIWCCARRRYVYVGRQWNFDRWRSGMCRSADSVEDGLINTPVTIQSDTPGKPTKDIKKLPLIRGQKPAKNNQNRESVASCQTMISYIGAAETLLPLENAPCDSLNPDWSMLKPVPIAFPHPPLELRVFTEDEILEYETSSVADKMAGAKHNIAKPTTSKNDGFVTIPLDDEIELTENGMLSVPEHENWSYPLPVTEKKKKRSSRSRSANRKKKNNKAKDTPVGKAPVSETENTKIAHSDKKSGTVAITMEPEEEIEPPTPVKADPEPIVQHESQPEQSPPTVIPESAIEVQIVEMDPVEEEPVKIAEEEVEQTEDQTASEPAIEVEDVQDEDELELDSEAADHLCERLKVEIQDELEHITIEELMQRCSQQKQLPMPVIDSALAHPEKSTMPDVVKTVPNPVGPVPRKTKTVSPVIVELVIDDLVHKVSGSDEVAKPYDHLLFLDVPPGSRMLCRKLFYDACVRNRCLIIVEPNWGDTPPTDPIAYVHEAIAGRAVRRVANTFKENGILVHGIGAVWFQRRNIEVVNFLAMLNSQLPLPVLAIPAAKFYLKQYKSGEALVPLDLRHLTGVKQPVFNPCFSSGSYLLRVIDFYGKLVGVPIAPGDDKKAIYTLLPEQAQRLGVALQGVRLVIPHEPWRRYRFRRFVFCSGEKPVMMTHPKLGLVTVQEYYEQEYNYQIQLPHMPLLVVVHKKQEMMLPMEMVFVDQFNWVFPRIDVAHLIHSMVLRGVIPAGLPPTPRNNFEVEYMMRILRPYHGVILRGEPALDMYSDKLMKDFLGAYKMERSFAEMAQITGMPLWQVIQIVKMYLMWDRAVIVHPIHAKNLYSAKIPKIIPPPRPLMQTEKKLSEEFESQFPGLSLEETLQGFFPPKTLGQFMTEARGSKFGKDVVRYLLLHRLLQQLHPCPVLQQKHLDRGEKEESEPTKEATFLPKPLLEKIRATPFDAWAKQRIRVICYDELVKGKRDATRLVDTLLRLIPWLNGCVPVKEIAFHAGISEAEVNRVLSTFYELISVEYAAGI